MLFGVPIAWTFIIIAWFYLVKVAYPSEFKHLPRGKAVIQREKEKLGKASYEEIAVFIIFIGAALAWISRSFVLQELNENIDDTVIALVAALILFIIPSKNRKGYQLLDRETAVKLPWGIRIVFCGGLAIAVVFIHSSVT